MTEEKMFYTKVDAEELKEKGILEVDPKYMTEEEFIRYEEVGI